jgi:hypothetical protein
MKKYTIDVNECSPPPSKRQEPPKSDSFSFGILFLAILATFILFPESVDTVNEYYKQQKELYHLRENNVREY